MKILICNDDGIFAPGLIALAKELVELGKVTIVAPDRERSAASNSLTLSSPLRVREVDFPINVNKAYSVTGTPADCAKIALSTLLDEKPDILVSGINRGPNMCVDVFYSGTVAAAFEGAFDNIHSFSVSLDSFTSDADFSIAAKQATICIKKILKQNAAKNLVYNINVPAIPESDIKGIEVTKLGELDYNVAYDKRLDPYGKPYYWISGTPNVVSKGKQFDVVAVRSGYVSVTPLKPDLTDNSTLTTMGEWFK